MKHDFLFTKSSRKLASCLVVFAFISSGSIEFAQANTLDTIYGPNGNAETLVCGSLASLGIGCGSSQAFERANPYSVTNNGSQNNQNSGTANSNNPPQSQNLNASISNAAVKRSASGDEVMLVKISANGNIKPTLGLTTADAIFEIIKGQRHLIPTADIFFDYGFNFNSVQNITRSELEKFPRVRLVQIENNKKKIYYITEGSMIRLIPNRKVFESYGNRDEDVITISKKESNFYSRNQFVFMENPFTGDVFQITESGTKKYVVPQALKAMKITSNQITPINRTEFKSYIYGQPITL